MIIWKHFFAVKKNLFVLGPPALPAVQTHHFSLAHRSQDKSKNWMEQEAAKAVQLAKDGAAKCGAEPTPMVNWVVVSNMFGDDPI